MIFEFSTLNIKPKNNFFDAEILKSKSLIDNLINSIPNDQLSLSVSVLGFSSFSNIISFDVVKFFILEKINVVVTLKSNDDKSSVIIYLKNMTYETHGLVSNVNPLFFSQAFQFVHLLDSLKDEIFNYLTYIKLSQLYIEQSMIDLYFSIFNKKFVPVENTATNYLLKFSGSFINDDFYFPAISESEKDKQSIFLRKIEIKSFNNKFYVNDNDNIKYSEKQIFTLISNCFYLNNTLFCTKGQNSDYVNSIRLLAQNNNDSFLELIQNQHILSNF